jgi:hypothetical protein
LYAENVIHRVHRKEEKKYCVATITIKCRRPSSLINGSVKKGKERIVEMKRERGLNEGRREEIGEKGLCKEKWKKEICPSPRYFQGLFTSYQRHHSSA